MQSLGDLWDPEHQVTTFGILNVIIGVIVDNTMEVTNTSQTDVGEIPVSYTHLTLPTKA